MNRIVKHRPEEGRVLYDYAAVSSYDDCPNRILCLSERSFNIILNALSPVEKMQTRVYLQQTGPDHYEIVGSEQFGNFQTYITNIYNELGGFMECNEYLERIAISLEELAEQQEHSVLNFSDVLEVLNLDPTEEQEDLVEAIEYLFTLMPSLPNFNIPKVDALKMIGDWRFRGGIINLLQDIALSQRGQAVAQGGVDMVGLYDLLGDTADKLLLPAGYVGKALWLWNRIKPSSLPGWFSWVTSITAIFLGSIRNGIYDLVDAIGGIDLSGIENAIRESTDVTIVNCATCAGDEITNIIDDGDYPEGGVADDDSEWNGFLDPPISDDVPWDEITVETDWKCQAAKYITDWLISFFQAPEWSLNLADNLFTLAEKLAAVLGGSLSIHFPVTVAPLLIAKILYGITSTGTTFVEEIGDVIDDLESDIQCALYSGTSIAEAAGNVSSILTSDGRLSSWQIGTVDVLLKLVNVTGLLFWATVDLVDAIESIDDNCDCGTALYQIVTAICTAETDGQFTDGNLVTIDSCNGNYFGTTRAGMNAAAYPDVAVNRWVEFVSATYGGTCFVTLVDENVPDGGNHMSAASLSAVAGFYSGFQVCRSDASDTTSFEVQIRVYEEEP